ncbi:Low choriolytic enzyme [Larimichthys crocea]|uniref:Uncharacterized protein n=1 Tax=Larimichthys crocea TaxID=215358 RepID=A0ACD3QEC6_LARCR|nr:Low choriolytic enzyme [Larimichthys crocea]
MATMKCILGLLALLAVSAWTEAGVVKKASSDKNDEAEEDLTVTEQLEKANNKLNRLRDGIEVNGDIAVSRLPTLRNADPCVRNGSSQELDLIKRGINSFSYSTCIRFFPRTNQRDYLHIQSLDGCYSYVGRQGNGQTVSLSRQGCIYYGTVQHELLHALGFNHEQCRSDRDQHIRVLLQNVIKDNYNPTMVAVPNPNSVFGTARQMSQNDINRINLLYCRN